MSAIVAGLLPKIEGFQPIPNAVMIPFMEAQSAALAYGFGLNYEYGKRKIRSMSNEEYNSLTSEDITNMSNAHTHIILSKFQLQVPAVMPMQTEIFRQYVVIEKAKVQQNFELAKWMVSFIKDNVDDILADQIAHLTGGHLHQTGDFTPPSGSPAYDSSPEANPNAPTSGGSTVPVPPANSNRKLELAKVNTIQKTWNRHIKDYYNASTSTKARKLIILKNTTQLRDKQLRIFKQKTGKAPIIIYINKELFFK